MGAVVVGSAVVGRGAAVVGVVSCFFVAFELFKVALMLPVTCGELDGVSEAEGSCAAVVVGAAVAEGDRDKSIARGRNHAHEAERGDTAQQAMRSDLDCIAY